MPDPEIPAASSVQRCTAPAVPPAREASIGALVPKRWARRAVTRNAIKRQIYAVSTDFEPRLTPAAHVVRLRAGFARIAFISATSAPLKQAVRAELQQLFEQVPASASLQRGAS